LIPLVGAIAGGNCAMLKPSEFAGATSTVIEKIITKIFEKKYIQVVQGESSAPEYALAQKSIPIDIKATPDDKFMLVTAYSKTFVDVISLIDERVIKQIDLTTQAEEIVVDSVNNRAYVSSSAASSIYIIDLNTMALKQRIKVKGLCQKLSLSNDGTKLFYSDKKNNDVWAIELNNNFAIKNIGKFPNVSKIVFDQNKVYIASGGKLYEPIKTGNGEPTQFQILDTPTHENIWCAAASDHGLILGGTDGVAQRDDTGKIAKILGGFSVSRIAAISGDTFMGPGLGAVPGFGCGKAVDMAV